LNTLDRHPLDVTVVTPTFNRASLIARALDSVRAQQRPPTRIIVVDDASSDGTPEVVRQWARQNNFPVTIEVLSQNSGPAVARNRGIELATTEYVAFLDSDDEHLPETLGRLVTPLDAFPDSVVSFADATLVSSDIREPHGLFRPRVALATAASLLDHRCHETYQLLDATSTLLKASIIPTSASCFRRRVAIAAGGMPAEFRSGEDWLFWLRLAQHGRFVFTLDDLALHHRHDQNLTHARSAEFVSREKLRGYLWLKGGMSGVPLTPSQHQQLKEMCDQQLKSWRYHLSRLGVREFTRGLRSEFAREIGSPLAHLLADPKSALRALVKTARRS
jgi:glycosyltransferase involved in cell wall biosynthesis